MARIDRVREEIGWFKVLFGFWAVIYTSLMGWMVKSYLVERNASEHPVLTIGALMALGVASVSMVSTIFLIRKRLKELEVL